MSASPSSRDLARNKSQRPSTPDQTRPSISRTGSFSVAPKSEYLRNALQARRAQNPTTPSPLDTRVPPSSTSKPQEIKTLRTSPDIFAEFALSEEQTAPVSPIRRRRPSDVGMPRPKTSRELTNEIEHLKNNLITANVRVELLKKNNSELQHDLTKLKEKAEEVDLLKDENHEISEENHHLTLKLQEMDDEMALLKQENDTLRSSNEEMLNINIECSSHWEDQELAVQEAADTIVALETEKAALVGEVLKMKERVSALEDDSSRASTLVDGSPRCPSRVYSIDESRPSTSHFDSDYYSQPDSPYVKTSRESVVSITPSERSRKFLDLTQERRRSARDLAKRMSAASLKALRIKSPAPEVPQIPAAFQQYVPQIVEQPSFDKNTTRAPKRYRERRLPEQPLLEALQISPTLSEPTAPRSPTPLPEGLRALHQSDQLSIRRVSNESRTSSSHARSPTKSLRSQSRQPSAEVSPRVPSRRSSKQAHTSSSNEYLSQGEQRYSSKRRQSEPDTVHVDTPERYVEECDPMSQSTTPGPSYFASQVDLTSEVDADDKDRWWRSVARLNQPQPSSYKVPPPTQQQRSPTLLRRQSHVPTRLELPGPAAPPESNGTPTDWARSSTKSDRKAKTQPSTPFAEKKDFMFNPTEDVDTFMRKAKSKLGGRR